MWTKASGRWVRGDGTNEFLLNSARLYVNGSAHKNIKFMFNTEYNGATNAASVLKNSATHVAQTRAELTLEIYGHQGLGWEGDAFSKEELETVRGWLSGKAMSIYGGSFEIQNNIISKRILGLPDNTQSS